MTPMSAQKPDFTPDDSDRVPKTNPGRAGLVALAAVVLGGCLVLAVRANGEPYNPALLLSGFALILAGGLWFLIQQRRARRG